MKNRLAYIVLAATIFALCPSLATAQSAPTGLRLTTSPLPISLTAKPGQTVTTDIRIRNSGSRPETLQVSLLTFTANGNGGGPDLRQRRAGDDFFDWVTFSDKEFTLAPNQWHTTKMTIKVPTTAAFGYYYAATFSRVDKTKHDSDQQAVVIGATATLVLLEVDSPNAKRQLSVDSFKADKSWYEFLPANFELTIANTGNVHSVISGDIFITRTGSKDTIATLKVNELRGNILPDSKRSFANAWTTGFPVYDQPPIENGQLPKADLQWDFSQADQLRFGKYTAHAVLAYDDGSKDILLEATTDFWVVPWRIIIAAIVIGGLSLFGLIMIAKSIWKIVRNRPPADDF